MRSTKPKTDFGIEVTLFCAKTGMSVKELAELSGVKYATLIESTTGRCAGHGPMEAALFLWQKRYERFAELKYPFDSCTISA